MVRIKHRYLLVHILYPSPPSSTASPPNKVEDDDLPWPVQFYRPTPSSLTSQLLIRAIRAQIQFLYGDWGAGVTASSLSVKYLSSPTSTFILRVAREHFRIVGAALAWLTELPGPSPSLQASSSRKKGEQVVSAGKDKTECVFRVVRVSGTIRKSEEEALRRAKGMVWKLKGREEAGEDTMMVDSGLRLSGEKEGQMHDEDDKETSETESDEEDEIEDDDRD